jgi:hypothetical protein
VRSLIESIESESLEFESSLAQYTEGLPRLMTFVSLKLVLRYVLLSTFFFVL